MELASCGNALVFRVNKANRWFRIRWLVEKSVENKAKEVGWQAAIAAICHRCGGNKANDWSWEGLPLRARLVRSHIEGGLPRSMRSRVAGEIGSGEVDAHAT